MSNPPVLIVGAGPTGLACARALRDAGRDVTVIESSSRVGGRLGSTVVEGIVCDLGAISVDTVREAIVVVVPVAVSLSSPSRAAPSP